jgi:hypothetical protein
MNGDPSRTSTKAQNKGLHWLTHLKALIAPKWLLSALAHQKSSSVTTAFSRSVFLILAGHSRAVDLRRP